MKIAVLLFGHLRTYRFCAPLLKKNLLSKYDCDVFIHTWDKIDSETASWNNKQNIDFHVNKTILKEVNTLYQPKQIFVEHQNINNDTIVHSEITNKSTSLKGMNYMFRSLFVANHMREQYEKKNNISYDLILATRPDIALFHTLPNLEETNKEAKALNLDLKHVRFFTGLYNHAKANVSLMCHRGCDMLFWGHSQAINTFINSNQNLTEDSIKSSFYNVSTIYTANEIKNGNIPQLVCLEFGKEWKNIRFNDKLLNNSKQKKEHSKLYKFFHFYWIRGKK